MNNRKGNSPDPKLHPCPNFGKSPDSWFHLGTAFPPAQWPIGSLYPNTVVIAVKDSDLLPFSFSKYFYKFWKTEAADFLCQLQSNIYQTFFQHINNLYLLFLTKIPIITWQTMKLLLPWLCVIEYAVSGAGYPFILKRESGETPERTGHCIQGANFWQPLHTCVCEKGKRAMICKSGNLPGIWDVLQIQRKHPNLSCTFTGIYDLILVSAHRGRFFVFYESLLPDQCRCFFHGWFS